MQSAATTSDWGQRMSDWLQDQFFIAWPNVWGARNWILPACIMGGLVVALTLWAYATVNISIWWKLTCALLKAVAVVLLAAILVEPMHSDTRPVPGANVFAVLADRSQSLLIHDQGSAESRASQLSQVLRAENPWQVRLGQDFDVRRYEFDNKVRPVTTFEDYAADGSGSGIVSALSTLRERFSQRPTAGILLLSDGNATDLSTANMTWEDYPPVYPVVLGSDEPSFDVAVSQVAATQTNFEAAPITITSEIVAFGLSGNNMVVELLDEQGEVLQLKKVIAAENGRSTTVRFQVKPESRGVLFYEVKAHAESEEGMFGGRTRIQEATLLNNSRKVMVDRGRGPYNVLYVSGRPNWEFKYLNRALSEDDELKLHGLIRIAKKEPRFQFREKDSNANRIFTNTDDEKKEQVEQYDEAVLLRVGSLKEGELSGGFPKSADELFQYHAIILDDVEADFFTQQQMSLIQDFVSLRGGGLLMLGGMESFSDGDYNRTSIGELLPVYLNPKKQPPPANELQLSLTREGLLEPWVRVRSTEEEESRRLKEMPKLRVLNSVSSLKPAASQLLSANASTGGQLPVLVTQRFGKGRTAAFMIGDLWRWKLHQDSPENDDLEKAWRQTIRWLVAEVPQRISAGVSPARDDANRVIQASAQVRDENYEMLDNAKVDIAVTTPEGNLIQVASQPKGTESGIYEASIAGRNEGIYRATIAAQGPDGSRIGEVETGWVSDPAREEFATLRSNREFLETVAQQTGGEVIELNELDRFVSTLNQREIPVTEPQVRSIWHTWGVFLIAVMLLSFEWGLRRWKGLA